MTDSHDTSEQGDERVDAILADYLQALEQGETPDRAKLIEANPHFADELRAFFADHDQFAEAAAPFVEDSTPRRAAQGQAISVDHSSSDPNAETTDG
ncbi:MAG: hypothetical protein WD768_01805, partial [Phycisphaeraceae bacterium]